MRLSRLTEEQRRVVAHPKGQGLVNATAGAGKTTCLMALIYDLIKNRGVDPATILCVTYTKSAADQMRPKLALRTGPELAQQVTFKTFHAFAYMILREAGATLKVIEDSGEYLRPIMQAIGLRNTDATAVENMATDIGRYINMLRPSDYQPGSCLREHFVKVLDAYEEVKKDRAIVDFNDLLEMAVAYLEKTPIAREAWKARYTWRLVDEYQDCSPLQVRFFYLTVPDEEPNLLLVGDDDQSIMSFQGSDVELMVGFPKQHPKAPVYPLSINHRCPKPILEPAARLIAHNKNRIAKSIQSEKEGKYAPVVLRPVDPAQELDQVVAKLKEIHQEAYQEGLVETRDPIAAQKKATQALSTCAVLYRTTAQSFGLISRLEEEKLAFHVLGGKRDPFNRWMAKDVLAYLRVAHGKGGQDDLDRVMRRPRREGMTGETFKILLSQAVKATQTPLDAIGWLAVNGGFWTGRTAKELLANLKILPTLKAAAAIGFILDVMDYRRGVMEYCEWSGADHVEALENVQALTLLVKPEDPCSVYLDLAAKPPKPKRKETGPQEGAVLTTIHSAKGREWLLVYVIGTVAQNHPRQTARGSEDMEEARRLFYVAMTRSKEQLILSVPQKWAGASGLAQPSVFLEEAGLIPPSATTQPNGPRRPGQVTFKRLGRGSWGVEDDAPDDRD